MRTVYLSHTLSTDTPAYGGGPSLVVEQTRSIERGDTANAATLRLSNHLGTHIDFPRHFVRDGKCLDDYPPSFFTFARVVLVEAPGAGPGTVIGPEVFEAIPPDPDADMILALTGMGRLRADPDYWQKNPVFSPEIADLIRRDYPRVRAFGFDAISLSSWTDRETGRAAHRAFLGGDRPILILEDMDLSPLGPTSRITRVTVCPLRVAGADAAPVTVIAEVEP